MTDSQTQQTRQAVLHSSDGEWPQQIASIAEMAAIRLLTHWDAFRLISQKPMSCIELATALGADKALVMRFARMLISTGKIEQRDDGLLRLAPAGQYILTPSIFRTT
jgi:predicted transcriptional regulator